MKNTILVIGVAVFFLLLATCMGLVVLFAPWIETLSDRTALASNPMSSGVPAVDVAQMQSQDITPAILVAVHIIETGDPDPVAKLVRSSGLVIAPYAVGAPTQGLKGEDLSKALEAILRGTHPKVVAYDIAGQGRVDLVVTGLNPAEITPAVGDALMMTSPALVSMLDTGDGKWELWLVAVDNLGLLKQNMTSQPYRPWPSH